MTKKFLSFTFLVLLMVSVISACQTQPDSNSEDIVGSWTGEAQWMCGHGDLPWATAIKFKSDGSFTATMTIPNLPESVGDGNWSLSENNIEIKFSTTVWNGTFSSNKMEGTFKDDRDPSCKGNWSLTRQ
jgi:hypothetical protein